MHSYIFNIGVYWERIMQREKRKQGYIFSTTRNKQYSIIITFFSFIPYRIHAGMYIVRNRNKVSDQPSRGIWLEPEPPRAELFDWSRSRPEPSYLTGAGAARTRGMWLEPEPPRAEVFDWSRSRHDPRYSTGAGAAMTRGIRLKTEPSLWPGSSFNLVKF